MRRAKAGSGLGGGFVEWLREEVPLDTDGAYGMG